MTAIEKYPAARRSQGMAVLVVLASGGMLLALQMGLRQSLGLFLLPMTQALGWSASVFTLAIGLQQLLWGVTQPFAGIVADRWGTARVLVVGAVLFAAGLALMGASRSLGPFYLGAGVLLGLGASAVGFPIVFGSLTRSVPPAWRSLALGVATMAGSFGQFALAPVTQGLIGGFGWSTALLALAALALLCAPMALPLAGRSEAVAGDGAAGSLGEALREALSHRSFWYLMAGFFTCGFHITFIATHMPGVVASCLLPPSVGAAALAVIGLANMAGSYAAGALGGRLPKKYLLSGTYFLRALGILAFLLAPKTEATVLIFSAAMGFLWLGTVPLTSGLVGHIYGTRYLATLFGIVFLAHQLGAFFGAWLGGYAFDTTGSYTSVWVIDLLLAALAGLLNLPVIERALRPTTA
jgi:MFS family permease